MKMSKILSLVLALVMVLSCFVGCFGPKDDGQTPDGGDQGQTPGGDQGQTPGGDVPVVNPLAGTYDITMWVSEKTDENDPEKSVVNQMYAQIEDFMAENPGIVINATISGVTEADAGSKVVADVATAPDIYCFAQDQLARLVQASALAAPGGDIAKLIKENNDANSVYAASVAGQLYAYPMTSDNGYYMYYDKSVVTDPSSLEKIIADCEAAYAAGNESTVIRYALENAWYTASFFFATGCHSNWTMDEAGNFTSVDDDFNSANGLIAMKGMQKLAQSNRYDSNADIFTNAAVVVTGIWNANSAEAHFGENLGVAKLPSFTVDGESYQLGSYSGHKLMGVKPQEDPVKGAVLQLLAQYLTNEKCQLERADMWQWGPSNLAAQQDEAVKANPSLIALADQNQYATMQGNIHGSWWDIAKVLGADAKAATSDEQLQASLDAYTDAIGALFEMTEEEKRAWSVIGTIGGTDWDTDFSMTEGPDGTWTSVVINATEGEEYKVRQGKSWDNNYGQNGAPNGANIKVEVSGSYRVVLTLGDTVTIELVPAE